MGDVAWFDQVLAAPTVGVLLHPWMGFPAGIWTSLERMGEKWNADGEGSSNITARGAVAVRVERESGLFFDLTPSNLVCGFTYRLSLRQRPGELPALNQPDLTRKYTELLERTLNALADLVASDSGGPRHRRVVRVGVVADCRLAEEAAPPGLAGLVEHLAGFGPANLKACESSCLHELRTFDGGRDQCHHAVSKNSYDRPGDLGFRLDWQRVWEPNRNMTGTELDTELRKAAADATSYFQRFGAGEVGDEGDHVGSTVG